MGESLFDRYFSEQLASGDPWDCWECPGYRNRDGYVSANSGGKSARAHQHAFREWHGRPAQAGLEIMHLCDNPPCINPCHLKEGTHRENVLDSHAKGRSMTVIPTLQSMAKHKANTPRGEQSPMKLLENRLKISGEANGNSQLTWEIARDIRTRRAAGESLKEIAALYNVSLPTVSAICLNQIWVEPGVERQRKRKGKPGPESKPPPVFTCQRPGCGQTFSRRKHAGRESKYCSCRCAATANYVNLGPHAQGKPPS